MPKIKEDPKEELSLHEEINNISSEDLLIILELAGQALSNPDIIESIDISDEALHPVRDFLHQVLSDHKDIVNDINEIEYDSVDY